MHGAWAEWRSITKFMSRKMYLLMKVACNMLVALVTAKVSKPVMGTTAGADGHHRRATNEVVAAAQSQKVSHLFVTYCILSLEIQISPRRE